MCEFLFPENSQTLLNGPLLFMSQGVYKSKFRIRYYCLQADRRKFCNERIVCIDVHILT